MTISIKNFKKNFSDKIVLNNINLEIKQGEIFGLIGLNGAGKTTLIKSILRLINIYEGNIKISSIDNTQDISRNNIAYLPEKFSPPANLTGKEFIDFTLSHYKITYVDKIIHQHCKDLDLDETDLFKKVTKYSKGMVQKLSLIATFASNRKIYILDEPMSGLDPHARIFLKKKIQKIAKEKSTIFLSSHILSDLQELCNRVAVLHDTELQFVGKPNDLVTKYKSDNLESAFLKIITN